MSFIAGTAPWQVGPVSSLGRITAGALVAVALDLLFAWQTAPGAVLALVLLLALVAVRVVRGFDQSLSAAALTFGAVGVTAVGGLVLGTLVRGAARSALVVAVALAIFGIASAIAAWLERRRLAEPAVIEIARTLPDGLARARRRSRVYR